MHNPASPGELLKEFLGKRTIQELADHIGVTRATISRIIHGHNAVTVDLSIRLGEALELPRTSSSKLSCNTIFGSNRRRDAKK
jgi:addiction module HigA family antidote